MKFLKCLLVCLILLVSLCFVTSCELSIFNYNDGSENQDKEIDSAYVVLKKSILADIDALALNYNEVDYYPEDYKKILDLIENSKEEVHSLNTVLDLAKYSLPDLELKLNEVKTIKEIELIEIKNELLTAIDTLALSYLEENYREDEWYELTELINNTKTIVNGYNTLTEVDGDLVDNLRISLDEIKTDNELQVEEVYDDLSFHFLELGNASTGDSTFIKAGDIDILIDAGSDFNSIETITNYIDQYCTDGILEYVIVTHAHLDHIAGFAPYDGTDGIFELYECEVIIDFALKNTTSQVSSRYIERRDKEILQGAKHYTAADCVNQTNGGQPVFQITESITMEILDHDYYHQTSDDENNYSVCTLFTQGNNNYLLTGDLEKDGEESLVEKNDLPHCVLYKGGHHGSKTSSNDCLLDEITPEICAVCCCAGTSEYTKNTDNQFPTQEFINRIAKHTDKVYVTSTCNYEIATSDGVEYIKHISSEFKPLNGNIVVSSVNCIVSVNCSNNNTKLKDSIWFNTTITLNGVTRKMRTWPDYGVLT